MESGQGYIPFTVSNYNTQTLSPPISILDQLQAGISQLCFWSPDLMGRHASKTPERASLGRASLQPCSLDL